MSFSLEHYKAHKQQLENKLSQLNFVLTDLKQVAEIKQIDTLKQQLGNDQFQVVVVGEFSRGKSTFINAFLGKKLLPSSAKPTTTILNTILFSEEPYIHLHYHDKTKPLKSISEEEFASLVAPREPIQGDSRSENEYKQEVDYLQSIKFAEIGHPIPLCEEGVTIIDTPGINDLDAAREQITNNIIPRADAAILLLSAVKILSDPEMSFLRDRILASDIQKIFIVVNFKDDLNSVEDENKVLNKALTELKPILGDVKLYLVSAREALNTKRIARGEVITRKGKPIPVWDLERTGFVELESDLSDFLQYDRGAVKLQKPIKRAQKIIGQTIKKQIQFEKKALTQSSEHLQAKVSDFRRQLQNFRQTGISALKILDYELAKSEDQLKNWYEAELLSINLAGMSVFDMKKHTSDIEDIPNLVEMEIAPLERKLHVEKEQKVEASLERAIEKSSEKLNEEWAKLDQQFQKSFMLSSKETSLSGELVQRTTGIHQEGVIFFEDLVGELADSWTDSTTLLGKTLSGAGIAVTVVVYGLFEIGSAIASWLFGEDKVGKLRTEISKRLDSSKQQKTQVFKKELRDLTKAVKGQYELMIENQVTKKEQQLQILMDNTQLKESELAEKLHWVERQEQQLAIIYRDLALLEKEMSKRIERVEV